MPAANSMYAVIYRGKTLPKEIKLFFSFEKAHEYLAEVSKETFGANEEITPDKMTHYSSDPFNNDAYQMIEVEDHSAGFPSDLLVVLIRSFTKEKRTLQKAWAYDCAQCAYQDMQEDYCNMLSCFGGVLNSRVPSSAFLMFNDCSFYSWHLWFAQLVE